MTPIQYYLSLGINLIPVREKAEIKNGRTLGPKTPFEDWKKWKTARVTEKQLAYDMHRFKTEAIAFVLGACSNNLFVIDIDTKFYPGFDAIYFAAIKDLFPEIWERLRIHKTPSGGAHILYFMQSPPPGATKLASRLPTPEEIIDHRQRNPNAKQDLKSVCFLETRGEGSLTSATGEGYSISRDLPIPTITDQEHESLLNLGRTFHQIAPTVTPMRVSKFQESIFDENPFEHFNASPEGEKVLENNGWTITGRNASYIWYSRPGSKSKEVHASFNFQKRCFYIFTSSTSFEPEKGYNPSTALAHLQFNGDKKATFKHLQDIGFGKVKKAREMQVIKSAAKSKSPVNLPANFSEEAKEILKAERITQLTKYPHGTFWNYNDDGKLQISRESLYQVGTILGFRLYKGELKYLQGMILHAADERFFQDTMKSYINESNEEEQEETLNAYEAFMQKNGKYTISRLQIIKPDQVLRDTSTECYKFFKNGYLKVTADAAQALGYEELDKYVLKERIQDRDYNLYIGGLYLDYLQKSTDWHNQKEHIMRVIGYLSHEWKDETTGYIIVLTEQCPDPKDGGGAGKNIFCNLLNNTTTVHTKAGSQVKYDEKFFQSWSGQRIMVISDTPENFKFDFLKEPATGSLIHKKLWSDEVEISVEDGPKFVIPTNFSYKITDGGLRRRMIPIEFTDFFTRCGGVDVHYGKHFPKQWTMEDWHGYDTLIMQSVQKWLQGSRKLSAPELTKTGWEKQFEHTYGKHMVAIIAENIDRWKEIGKVKTKDLKIDISNYLNENNVPKMYWPSSERQNEAIKVWCEHQKIPIKVNVSARDELSVVHKYFIFGAE